MQIEIYSALTNLRVPQDAAEKTVKALEAEMDKRIDFGVNAVRADIAALTATVTAFQAETRAELKRLDSKIDHKVDSIRWMIGILVPAAAIVVTAILAYLTHLK